MAETSTNESSADEVEVIDAPKKRLKEGHSTETLTVGPSAPAPTAEITTTNAKKKQGADLKEDKELKSDVWPHYTRVKVPLYQELNGEQKLVGHTTKAQCTYCEKLLECRSVSGTTTLRRHIEMYCKKYAGRVKLEKGQRQIRNEEGTGKLRTITWSQHNCIEAATHMIVVDELPFSHVEKPGFRYFCRVVAPLFKVPCRKVIMKNFLLMYDHKKEELRRELSSHSVSLTTDTWTSCQNINYMVVTAHFIDALFHMHKRVLAFCEIQNHKGETIGEALEKTINHWKIENVLCISVDNAASNKVAIDYLRTVMCGLKTKPLLGGRFMHVRCLAHIVNLIVRAGLKELERSVTAIRNAVLYVRGSPQRQEEFKRSAREANCESQKTCILDVPTRWNSTFLMLDTALEYRKGFARLYKDDLRFRIYFDEDNNEEINDERHQHNVSRKRIGPPTDDDWDKAAVFVKFLRVFYDVTLTVSKQLKPTAHKAFHEVVSIEAELEELSCTGVGGDSSNAEVVLHNMAVYIKTKYNKYFGELDNMNQLFLVALVLDPRYKLNYIGFMCANMLGMDSVKSRSKMEKVKQLLVELCDIYSDVSKGQQKHVANKNIVSAKNKGKARDRPKNPIGKKATMKQDWDRQLEENHEVVGHEVDRYLLDPIEKPPQVEGEDEDEHEDTWDILNWWRGCGSKYPSLQALARDVLAIQVSTVASESSFSTGKRVIDPYRSSLTPQTVEKLICLQNWLKSDAIMGLQYLPEPEEMELYEELEVEHLNQGLEKTIAAHNVSGPSISIRSTKSSEASASVPRPISNETSSRKRKSKN